MNRPIIGTFVLAAFLIGGCSATPTSPTAATAPTGPTGAIGMPSGGTVTVQGNTVLVWWAINGQTELDGMVQHGTIQAGAGKVDIRLDLPRGNGDVVRILVMGKIYEEIFTKPKDHLVAGWIDLLNACGRKVGECNFSLAVTQNDRVIKSTAFKVFLTSSAS